MPSGLATKFMDLFNNCLNATSEDDFDKVHQKLVARAVQAPDSQQPVLSQDDIDPQIVTEHLVEEQGQALLDGASQQSEIYLGNNDDSAAWLRLTQYLEQH